MSKNYEDMQKNSSRLFGEYYRVKFFGAQGEILGEDHAPFPHLPSPPLAFGAEMHLSQYIYREPSATKLPEIAGRLESEFRRKCGVELEMIKDSRQVRE